MGSTEIAANAAGQPELAPDSVGASEVIDASLGELDLATNSVDSAEITSNAVGTAELDEIPSVRARRTGVQSIPFNAPTAIQLTSETHDTTGLHSNVTNNSRLIAPTDGIYVMTANIFWFGGSNGERSLSLRLNGEVGAKFIASTNIDAANSGSFPFMNISTVYDLNSGDFVEAVVQQNDGSSNPIDLGSSSGGPETSPEATMSWLGPSS